MNSEDAASGRQNVATTVVIAIRQLAEKQSVNLPNCKKQNEITASPSGLPIVIGIIAMTVFYRDENA